MNNEELVARIKNAKYSLENAKKQLNYAQQKLSESIVIDNSCFKNNVFNNSKSKIDVEINYINNRIIPKINS